MPANETRHRMNPLQPAMLARSTPDMGKERNEEASQRERDRLFLRRLAQAFEAGHHLPKGQVPELRLRG